MRALIVDDEPTVRLLLSRILRREVDCAVTEATNGIEALDLLARDHFDFAVIDVMMPLMDGVETLEAIRASSDLRHLPVMVLSAVRDEGQVRQLIALGISAYLTKPLRPADVSARVRRFVATIAGPSDTPSVGQDRRLVGLTGGAKVLVVDGDPDFRQFVTTTLGTQYVISEAEGGAQGLRACLDARPAAILLGEQLGPVPRDLFLRKLRSLPGLAGVPVVVVRDPDDDTAGAEGELLLPRTFDPEAFQRQLTRLVSGLAANDNVLAPRPELRAQMIGATEQVFGMMLGTDVASQTDSPSLPTAGTDVARVVLALDHESSDIEFGILAERCMSERMTAVVTQGADVITDAAVADTLRSIVNTIGGRLQTGLRARGDAVVLGEPTAEVVDQEDFAGWSSVGFQDAAGKLRFVVYVRPRRRPAESARPIAAAS